MGSYSAKRGSRERPEKVTTGICRRWKSFSWGWTGQECPQWKKLCPACEHSSCDGNRGRESRRKGVPGKRRGREGEGVGPQRPLDLALVTGNPWKIVGTVISLCFNSISPVAVLDLIAGSQGESDPETTAVTDGRWWFEPQGQPWRALGFWLCILRVFMFLSLSFLDPSMYETQESTCWMKMH